MCSEQQDGLLCTGDGMPTAHHVSAGNTADASTLPGVLADLIERFAVGRICVVADRGLISVAAVAQAGCDQVFVEGSLDQRTPPTPTS